MRAGVDWMTSQETPLLQNTAGSKFTNEAMADELLRFLEGYIKGEKIKTDAIHGNFPSFRSISYIFEEKGLKK